MKISIIYYSKTGKTKEMAEIVAAGAKSIDGVEVQCFDVDNIDNDYLADSKAVIFGTPSYYANMCWQLKKWFDTANVSLEGKLGAAFCTANWTQGGGDVAILALIQHMLVKSMITYSGGQALGKPFTHLGAVAVTENFEESKPMFEVFGKRIATKAVEIFK